MEWLKEIEELITDQKNDCFLDLENIKKRILKTFNGSTVIVAPNDTYLLKEGVVEEIPRDYDDGDKCDPIEKYTMIRYLYVLQLRYEDLMKQLDVVLDNAFREVLKEGDTVKFIINNREYLYCRNQKGAFIRSTVKEVRC